MRRAGRAATILLVSWLTVITRKIRCKMYLGSPFSSAMLLKLLYLALLENSGNFV